MIEPSLNSLMGTPDFTDKELTLTHHLTFNDLTFYILHRLAVFITKNVMEWNDQ